MAVIEKQMQQGDVNIVQLNRENYMAGDSNIVFRLRDQKVGESDGIVRRGSTTGHSHRIMASDFRMINMGGERMVCDILSDDGQMVHEEHEAIPLPRGLYMFKPTFQYDHFANRSRYVRD